MTCIWKGGEGEDTHDDRPHIYLRTDIGGQYLFCFFRHIGATAASPSALDLEAVIYVPEEDDVMVIEAASGWNLTNVGNRERVARMAPGLIHRLDTDGLDQYDVHVFPIFLGRPQIKRLADASGTPL